MPILDERRTDAEDEEGVVLQGPEVATSTPAEARGESSHVAERLESCAASIPFVKWSRDQACGGFVRGISKLQAPSGGHHRLSRKSSMGRLARRPTSCCP